VPSWNRLLSQEREQFDDVLARTICPRHRQPVPAHLSPVRHTVDALPLQAELLAKNLD
jgi:hypothetical protein